MGLLLLLIKYDVWPVEKFRGTSLVHDELGGWWSNLLLTTSLPLSLDLESCLDHILHVCRCSQERALT